MWDSSPDAGHNVAENVSSVVDATKAQSYCVASLSCCLRVNQVFGMESNAPHSPPGAGAQMKSSLQGTSLYIDDDVNCSLELLLLVRFNSTTNVPGLTRRHRHWLAVLSVQDHFRPFLVEKDQTVAV